MESWASNPRLAGAGDHTIQLLAFPQCSGQRKAEASWEGTFDILKVAKMPPSVAVGQPFATSALITATDQASINLARFDGVIITELRTVTETRAAIFQFIAVMVENLERDGGGVFFFGLRSNHDP
jgi:hypothetical protein